MIDLVETDEQAALVSAAAGFLDKASGPEFDLGQAWPAATAQGWLAIGVPESLGGVGYGLPEQALLLRELGRHASPLPVLESMLAVTAARTAVAPGCPADEDLLRDLVAGSGRVCVAQRGPEDEVIVWDHADPPGYVLIVASDEVDLVPPSRLQMDEAAATLDPLYRLRRARWDGAGSLAHGTAPAAAVVRAHALILTAALLSGIAAQTRDASVAHAKQRVQYGRPIGAFQAVKHRCADMAVRAEAAWCMTALAALGVQRDTGDGQADAYSARIVAADAALRNSRDNIQNHGAMGFTAELAAHGFLKRAHVLSALLVTSAQAKAALLAEDSSR